MKRLMLIGPSQCGKTSLTQGLRGEALHYKKTQAIEWSPMAIDTPGEYLENRCLYSALLTSACEADVIALVLNADAQWSPFSPLFPIRFIEPTFSMENPSFPAILATVPPSSSTVRKIGKSAISLYIVLVFSNNFFI